MDFNYCNKIKFYSFSLSHSYLQYVINLSRNKKFRQIGLNRFAGAANWCVNREFLISFRFSPNLFFFLSLLSFLSRCVRSFLHVLKNVYFFNWLYNADSRNAWNIPRNLFICTRRDQTIRSERDKISLTVYVIRSEVRKLNSKKRQIVRLKPFD